MNEPTDLKTRIAAAIDCRNRIQDGSATVWRAYSNAWFPYGGKEYSLEISQSRQGVSRVRFDIDVSIYVRVKGKNGFYSRAVPEGQLKELRAAVLAHYCEKWGYRYSDRVKAFVAAATVTEPATVTETTPAPADAIHHFAALAASRRDTPLYQQLDIPADIAENIDAANWKAGIGLEDDTPRRKHFRAERARYEAAAPADAIQPGETATETGQTPPPASESMPVDTDTPASDESAPMGQETGEESISTDNRRKVLSDFAERVIACVNAGQPLTLELAGLIDRRARLAEKLARGTFWTLPDMLDFESVRDFRPALEPMESQHVKPYAPPAVEKVETFIGQHAYAIIHTTDGRRMDIKLSPGKSAMKSLAEYAAETQFRAQELTRKARTAMLAASWLEHNRANRKGNQS